MTCKLCGQEIEDPRRAWIEVTGYVAPQGKDSMLGRHDTGEYVCVPCIIRIRTGVPAEQGTLM